MVLREILRCGCAVAGVCGAAVADALAADFRGLGIMPDAPYKNTVRGMSTDGARVVIGGAMSPQTNALTRGGVWYRDFGFVPLQPISTGSYSSPSDMSANGAFVDGGSDGMRVRWSSATGAIVRNYGDLKEFNSARASGDGTTLVGRRLVLPSGNFTESCRWTEETGFQSIHYVMSRSEAVHDISEDADVVIGSSGFTVGPKQSYTEAWAWTAERGAFELEGNYQHVLPHILAPDASFIIGKYLSSTSFALVRWDLSGEAQILYGLEPNSSYMQFEATGVNTLGDLIVGNVGSFSPQIWTLGDGFIPFEQFLQLQGIDFTGWTLTSVAKMSADGLTFAGSGINPDGLTETWIATIPSPGCAAVAGIAAGLLAGRRRRGTRGDLV